MLFSFSFWSLSLCFLWFVYFRILASLFLAAVFYFISAATVTNITIVAVSTITGSKKKNNNAAAAAIRKTGRQTGVQ